MIEALLSLKLTCENANDIAARMMTLDYMTHQEKVEVVRELERAIPDCKINTKNK